MKQIENRVRKQWISYLAEVMPKDAHQTQVQECRRAFYAGALGCLIAGNLAEGTDQVFDEIWTELKQFNQDVKSGKA